MYAIMKTIALVFLVVFGGSHAAFNPLSKLDIPKNMTAGGKVWALLVAGSNTYMNYRHQVCGHEVLQIKRILVQ